MKLCRTFPLMALQAAVLAASSGSVWAKDLSAETMGVIHDVMAPYRSGASSVGPKADPAAVKDALRILNGENLVSFPRPTQPRQDISESLGKALAMGNRTKDFLPELADIHTSLVQQDEKKAKSGIQNLYQRMGRSRPEGKALDPLYQAADKVVGAAPPETERTVIKKPDYNVTIENAPAAGEAFVEVLMNKGPDNKPARVTFRGDVASQPDKSGSGLEKIVKPAETPETMTTKQAGTLRERINGKWVDQNGNPYEISGSGNTITVTEIKTDTPSRPYGGSFDLGRITASFTVRTINDIGASLPAEVRRQLVSMRYTFGISLSVIEDGEKLDGTWRSQHVTYSGMDYKISKVHDPYDVKLTLTRPGVKTAMGAAESALP